MSTSIPFVSPPASLRLLRHDKTTAEGPTLGGPAAAPLYWSSHQLFGSGGQEVQIAHGESVYRLRITSLGKLILTK